MTKDEAAQLVHDAIVAAGPQDQILGAGAFAQRLATALDALGLLAYAADPSTNTSSTADEALAQPDFVHWAHTRKRT